MSRTFYHFSFLYQNKKKEQVSYTDNPSGSFDLQRLIAGKPAWRQANYAHEAVRRKLIIHDWTFFNYTVIQKKDFYLLVEDLLEDGFEIYLWTGEIVKEITKENWYQYRWDPESYLRNSFSKYSPSAHIKKWAIDQLSWAEDDLFILDDYWLPVLRDNLTELPPRHLLISDLAQYSDAEEIISSALGLTPKIEHVILDEISTDSIEFYLKMQRYIESLGIKIIVHYKKLDIDTRALEILLQNDALYLGDHLIKKTDLYDIESVDLDSDEEFCLNHAELDELFSLMPKLKRVMNLVLNETILLNPIPHLEFLEVTQGQLFQELWGDPLKMLYLSHEGISDSIMISNLKNLSYLKESNTDFISDLTALKNLWHVSSSCFEYVEGVFFESAACINLGEIKLSDYNNPALLSYSSNLKKLTIETLPLIISHPIPTLEILCVKNITYAQLTEISRNFPNLKKLALSEIVTEYEANSIITSLNTLEILEIEGEISFDIATTLLQNAPNLQKLLIQCHEFIFENKTINLPKLEQITFKGNKSFLYLILKNAANIKQIQLNSISDSPRNDVTLDQVFVDNLHIKSMLTDTELVEILHVIKPNHLHLELNDGLNDNLVNLPLFSHLKSLSLIGYSAERYLVNTCFISNKLLNNLLLQTPRLKKLRLKSIQIEDKIFLSPTLSLPFLVDLEINLEKTSISLEDINLFGKIAPNLKVCKLDNAQQLFGRIISNHSLNNLEYLEIKSANLSGRDIENLLMSCPKLTKLILPGLKLTDDLLTEPFMSGVNELVLNQSLLSNTQLVQLLGYFPNLKRLLLRCCEHLVAETIRPFLEDIPIIDLFGAKETEYRTSENTHSQWCDFNTNLPSTTLSAKRYFYSLSSSVADPDTRFYRLQVFNQLKVNSEATRSDQLLQLTNQGDPQWRAVNDVKFHKMDDFINYAKEEAEIDQDSYHFFGQVFIELTSDWQALPSLSPFEVLPDIAFASEIPCDINYSLRDNLYYIRSTEGTVGTKTCYTVRIPCAYPNVIMPQALQDDINYLLQFNVGELRNIPQNANAINYLNLLWEQGIGACRHRSMLFLWRHAQDVRSIYNDGHAFVEVKIGGFWIMVNLGGYPAQLQIIDEFIAPTVSLNLHEERQQGEDPQIAIYATRLEPWRVQSSSWSNWNDFADEVVHPGQKILLEVNSPAELNPVWEALAHYCGINNLPYHDVANPDDLVCSLPYLAPREGLHKIQPGPGGVLYDFFMACNNAQLPGILIINYERFGIDDLIRTNTILDPERQIDGVLLPKSLIVIGIRNNARPDVYEGADFISRWDQRVQIPQALILNSIPPAAVMASPSCTLDLWDDPEAMELLLGRWRMMGAGFIYEDGLLNAAVAAGHRLLALRQAPPAVRALSHQISTLGWVVHNGKRLEFPQGLQFQWTEGYDWPRLRTALTWLKTPQTGALVLNPTLYPTFFKRYREDTAAQQLQTTPGWVEQATGQKLAVTLSRSLTEGQWAQLLHLCCLHQVSLQVFCPPSVSVPEVLGPQPQLNVPLVIPNTTVVISSERDTTVLKLLEQHPQARFADVSECTASDLWQHWQSRLDPENYCLRIWHEPGWVYQALSAGETVILTGTFRAEVQDALQGAWCGPDSELIYPHENV